jgi:DNA-binding MarR family transcriptional regulator
MSDEVLIALRKIIQSIDLNSRSLVKRVGLTGPQLLLLQEISKCGELSGGKLAKAVSLSQATVTGIVERLEKRGLVTRRRSQIDKRKVLVQVTSDGKDLLENAPSLMQESFVQQFGSLRDWEQAMILSSLQRLVILMDARAIDASPFLTTGPINDNPLCRSRSSRITTTSKEKAIADQHS